MNLSSADNVASNGVEGPITPTSPERVHVATPQKPEVKESQDEIKPPSPPSSSEATAKGKNKDVKVSTSQRTRAIIDNYRTAFNVVSDHFPEAQISTDLLHKVDNYLYRKGCTGRNTLYGQSVCSDEINHESGDITDVFIKHFGEVFHLGGLAGIPFTGRTGFKAFAAHVPKDGNLFILFAPHIGVTGDGLLGKYNRIDQDGDPAGAACGAAVGAFQYCMDMRAQAAKDPASVKGTEDVTLCPPVNSTAPTPSMCICATKVKAGQGVCPCIRVDPDDYQMDFIKIKLNQRYDDIMKAANKAVEKAKREGHSSEEEVKQAFDNAVQAALVKAMYLIAKESLVAMVTDVTNHPHVYVLGGIQINMPGSMPDLFEPHMFKLYEDGVLVADLEDKLGIPVLDE